MMGIFLIVVLGGVAVLLGKVASMEIHESTLDELGAIAKQAAKAGIEWGAFELMSINSTGTGVCPTELLSAAITLDSATTMIGFKDSITCSSYLNNSLTSVYLITVTACNSAACPAVSPPSTYVERNMTVTLCSSGGWTNLCSF